MTHTVLVVVAVIALVGYVIGRQLLGEPLRIKRVVVLPAVITVVGALDLGKHGRHPHPVDIVFIAASALVAIGIGVAQGTMMRLERRDSGLWGRMPVTSLWLWAALVAGRLLLAAAAAASGAHVAASSASILLVLGVNRLAQAAVIAARAASAGIPFSGEGGVAAASRSMSAGSRYDARPDGPAPTAARQDVYVQTGRRLAAELGTPGGGSRRERVGAGRAERRSARRRQRR